MRKLSILLSLVLSTLILLDCNKAIFSFSVKLDNNVYIDKSEVDVASWLSYYTWTLEHNGIKEAQKVLPDSTAVEPEIWKYINHKCSDYLNIIGDYTQLPVGHFCKKCNGFIQYDSTRNSTPEICPFLLFPMTGLTYEQVLNFCKWRTYVQGGGKVLYRLPTPEEWKYYALKSLSDKEKIKGIKDSILNNTCANFNFNYDYDCCRNAKLKVRPKRSYSYNKDNIGAYDIFGNVSEMTSVKGMAKGGNYSLYANQCHPDSIQYYNKPEKWLGFRCIAEKVSNRINYPSTFDNSLNTNKNDTDKPTDKFKNFEKYTDARDGKTYPIVQIGKKTWFAANLAYKADSARCWAYNRVQGNVDTLGYLYNWETAINVCPVGWHLPTKVEFDTLIQDFGGNETKKAYKELIPSGSSGFSIILAGYSVKSYFSPIGTEAAFWSSSENGDKKAWALGAGSLTRMAGVRPGFKKISGLSVRCIKDK